MALSEKAKQAQRQYKRQWNERNREHVREYHKDWRKRNPDKVKANNERYFEWLADRMANPEKSVTDNSNTVTPNRNANVTEKSCPVCGEPIEGKKKYCSTRCKQKAYRQNKFVNNKN